MSLCNTFRFLAVSTTVIICIVGSPVPELVSHHENTATRQNKQDLEHQESITLELKSDMKRPNDIDNLTINNAKDDTNSIPMNTESTKENSKKNSNQIVTSTDTVTVQNTFANYTENSNKIPLDLTTIQQFETVSNMSILNPHIESRKNNTSKDKDTDPLNVSEITDQIKETQTEVISTTELEQTTQDSLLNVKEESTINVKLEIETSAPATNIKTENSQSKSYSETSKNSIELTTSIKGITTPVGKKYIVIERKRIPVTDEPTTLTDYSTDITKKIVSTTFQEQTTNTDKSEVMVKSESGQGRITLEDAITSDIPSLEKLKTDLLSFSKFTNKGDTESITPLLSREENNTKTDMTTSSPTTLVSTLDSEPRNTVSSKRAGYLDLSVKHATADDGINLKANDTESLQGPFIAETSDTQDESPDDKVEKRLGSQSQLAEDAIKEELLKEEIMSNKEEISERNRDERKQIETETPATDKTNVTQFDHTLVQSTHTIFEDNLSVKPINAVKNTVLYPVNPNYKPLKKIEVQPAKPFVRDPDDNSWRNESLSSLGIVFKPKNSSKPFTQVLKNKTETEWNNLPDKDTKNELPDLRVRLEQIAQKRKSKKKKIDSYGNVFYTDYEENSSSEESTSTPQVKDHSSETVSTTDISTTAGVTIVTPVETSSVLTSTIPVSEENYVPAITTTAPQTEKILTTPKKHPAKVTTLKPPNRFNLFDYYEANDDEDISDYLNMAKIDLKKYTVPLHTTYTPFTSPPLPILYTNPMTQYTPERKGTIEYFPPRTTKRPRKNKNNYRGQKINALTLLDSPKHAVPISYHKLTTPYDTNTYYTNAPDMARLKDDLASKNFDRNLYLTTPPLTTLPDEDFSVVGNEGYNGPNYILKHYKDYTNEGAQELGQDKHREYAYTEPPRHDIEIAEYVKPTTVKDKSTVTEDYDYESQFRKELLDRFVANFNEKSNRFKSDYPVVYNNSIVHGAGFDEKDVAMSRAYFRRPYNNQEYKPIARDPYDPNCENVTVELSPAYELHYYIPEQEEKQEVEAKPINLPVRYGL